MKRQQYKKQQVAIIGGGIAGLSFATLISSFFESVTVFEPCMSYDDASPRKTAMQSSHLHVLLKEGQNRLLHLFPELKSEFEKHTCKTIDWGSDTEWATPFGIFPKQKSGVETVAFSRSFLEKQMYLLTKQKPNVHFLQEKVDRINLENPKRPKVATKKYGDLLFDFAIVATGQFFDVGRLFDASQFHLESVEKQEIDVTYTSARVELTNLSEEDVDQHYYQFFPPQSDIGAVISPIEKNEVLLTIIRREEQMSKLPGDFSQFVKLLSSIPNTYFKNVGSHLKPKSKVFQFRKNEMYFRDMRNVLPKESSVLFVGDSVCSLNPAFGQGMTASFKEVDILEQLLTKGCFSPTAFQSKVHHFLMVPWTLAKVGSDLDQRKFSKIYFEAYLKDSLKNAKRHRKFIRVLHMVNGPEKLLSLKILGQAILKYLHFQKHALKH